jgi:two-component system, cell cycle sensor histidine kinase and response regulator CckA
MAPKSGILALAALSMVLAFILPLGAAEEASSAADGSKRLRVLIDDNYPPYIMRNDDGGLQGILIDQWRLFERKTGVSVEIRAGDWGRMLAEMISGEGDVIDTAFYNKDRAAIFDFLPPYATIDVPIFVSNSISGIGDVRSLKGFLVGVKAGDASIAILHAAGVDTLKEYPSYEGVIQAARIGEIHVFCVDEPPALYLIYRAGLENSFKEAFTLYSGEFHRAVRKGNTVTAALVMEGFSKISRREIKAIDEKWMGRRLINPAVVRRAMWIGAAITALAVFLLAISLYLRFLVKRRTAELKRAVDELSDVKENLETLLKSNPDYLFVLNAQGRITEFHSRTKKNLLMEPEEFLGKDIREIMPPEVSAQALDAMEKTRSANEESSFEYSLDIKGDFRQYETRITPMKGSRFFVIVRDITRDKAMEAEAIKNQKLESLGLFAGGIAHDFNNILAAISGNVSLARMVATDPVKLDSFLDKAESAAIRARGLTDQLRTFSRGGEPVREPADFARLARETAAFALSGQACALKISEGEGPFMALVDPGQMAQVVQNIVLNAAQSMPGGGTVRLSIEREKIDASAARRGFPEGIYLCLSVADSGSGIPDSIMDRIFDPYYSTKSGGTGLGLSICHTIVTRHGGNIAVSSEEGKGSVFVIRIPAMDPPREEASMTPTAKNERVKLPRRVLVMDDEAILRDVMVAMLAPFQCSADSAAEGAEGLALFKRALADNDPYGLVVADLTVPGGMGGADMMKAMRATGHPIKSIVVSGYTDTPLLSNFKQHGFDAFLRKPFTRAEFLKVISSLFGESS